jgi:predicted permease
MQAILAVTIPFFALVLLGWFAARAYWLPQSAIPGLNAYVLFFALPCMLFRFGSSLPFSRLADPVLLAVYVLAALAIIALTVAVTVQRAGRAAWACATPPLARWSRPSRTPASWACRCWWHCSAMPPPAR